MPTNHISVINPVVLIISVLIGLTLTQTGSAQERKNVFANPQNLQVLPKDIQAADLGQTMKSFAQGLGVRCEYCHQGEAGQPLTTFDFADDRKPSKHIARSMLRMVLAINGEHLASIPSLAERNPTESLLDFDDDSLINNISQARVSCITCHRGLPVPRSLQHSLQDVLATQGLDATIQHYRTLREKYYGSHSYDFSESVLAEIAQTQAAEKAYENALALLNLNESFYPDSYRNHWLKGELFIRRNQAAKAREEWENALSLNPDARATAVLKRRIASLDDQPEGE